MIWHDTPERALATAGLSLAERRQGREVSWRLERTLPSPGRFWGPGTPAPLVCATPGLAEMVLQMAGALPTPLLPVAAFEGQIRAGSAADQVRLSVLSGEFRAVAATRAVCRVRLGGPAGAVCARAVALAESVSLSVPPTSLAAEAYATASGAAAPARRLGAPALSSGLSVDDAFAHIVAHLLDVILHFAPRALAGEAPEPVHQMRVAVRRLRSAFSLFEDAAGGAAFDEAKAELKALGAALGPARDWDVFCAGTCKRAVAAFPADDAILRMAAMARRKRDAGYAGLAAFLCSARFRLLGLRLAVLAATRPWGTPTPPGEVDPVPEEADHGRDEPAASAPSDLTAYARRALRKRLKRMLAAGEQIDALPTNELHDIRLGAKRLRYAAEFFAPLFPKRETRRFLKRMTALQERLGQFNDGDVATELMQQIGVARGFAGGAVRGLVAAEGAGGRRKIARSWKQMREMEPFWSKAVAHAMKTNP